MDLIKSFVPLFSRCITGALNGNIGVMKSMLGELTDSTNMARGFAFLPIAWSVVPSSAVHLHDHRTTFLDYFTSPFWAEFPYFLPCGVTAGFAMLAFGATLLFLEETLPPRVTPEKQALSVDREAGDREISYATIEQEQLYPSPLPDAPIPLSKLLNAARVLRIANYGVLAILEITLYSLQPLFYSTAIEYGGLGFSPMQIGLWMACFGIFNGLCQALFFASLVDRLGPKTLLRIGHTCFIPLFILFPTINWIAGQWGNIWLVWLLLIVHLALTIVVDMAFSALPANVVIGKTDVATTGCILMYITAAAPNRRCLGAINGVAQTTASIARAIGPASATSLFASSIQNNIMGGYGVYLLLLLVTVATMPLAAMLPDDVAERC
ncbi:major facilitator superfamily domain-containing protein [Chiua virens]|nr:major facilitator superfamily domain-containing protein [Chiua virens]